MELWKLPPKEKIYEAYSVLADHRFEMKPNQARVNSSTGDKYYTVTWLIHDPDIQITSNDNASRFQGYTGYPIIAMLMELNVIKFDRSFLQNFKGIEWNRLNHEHKNNYAEVVELILSQWDDTQKRAIREQTETIFEQLKTMNLYKLRKGN